MMLMSKIKIHFPMSFFFLSAFLRSGLYSKFIRTVSNLFRKFGIILHESSFSGLEGSYTCSDLIKKNIMKQWESGSPFISFLASLQTQLLLTGLKITSSARVMLPFDSPPKSSFFSGKAVWCPLRICRTERASGAELSHEPDRQSCWITS